MIVISKELYEDSIGVAKQHSCFAGVYFFALVFPCHESAVKFMMDYYSVSDKFYVSILSSLEVLIRLI